MKFISFQVPAATLIKLLTILQWNVRDGSRITPIISAVSYNVKKTYSGRVFTMQMKSSENLSE